MDAEFSARRAVDWRLWAAFTPVLALLVVWLPVQMNTSLNADSAWLIACAGRLLAGGHTLTDFYEPNPPLSILLYVPDVLLARLTGVPVWYMPYAVGLAAMGASVLAVHLLLKKIPELDGPARGVFTGAYVIASTAAASIMFFAERDEFVIWGMMPFLLAQLLLTRGTPVSRRLLWPVLGLGVACMLIKPHYLLLPGVVVLHRMLSRRRFFRVLRDPDVVALTVAVLAYALVIALFFREYVLYVLPALVKLYIPVRRGFITKKKAVIGLGMLAWLMWGTSPADQGLRRAARLCAGGAALCGFLFVLQDKGNYYHEIPFLFFFFCGAGLLLFEAVRRRLRTAAPGVFFSFCLLILFACFHAPVLRGFPTHADYKKLRLTELAAQAGPGGSFFVFSEGMEMIAQAALYSGTVHASRFPALWWLYGLMDGWGTPADARRYADYVAADLRRYKPAVMAIDANLYTGGPGYFDLIGWLSQRSPAFRAEMAHYRPDGQMTDNRRDYFRGATLDYDHPIVYDLYRRVP